MTTTTNIRQLKINKLTKAQYDAAVKNADELYLTPDDGSGGGTDLPDQTGQSGKFLTTNGSTLSWGSVPAGTVTSVQVQAGTGLTSSTSTAQNTTLSTTISIASGYKLPTTTEWNNNALPSQSGNEGKFLTTNGSTATWTDVQDSLDLEEMILEEAIPNQTGQSGKFLTTNGTTTAWATVSAGDALPSQTGNAGKFLTTNGSTASWGTPPQGTVTSVRVQAGTGLSSSTSTAQNTTLNTTISIASGYKLPTTSEWSGKQDALPSQSGNSGKFLTTDGTTMSWATVGSGGTSDYNDLTNKPSINSITLSGNKTGSDLGLVNETDLEEFDINNVVPDQTGNSGKFLTTNGSTVAWATVQGGGGDSLPDQTGQSGKFLTTNGTTASWANTTAVKFRDWSAS